MKQLILISALLFSFNGWAEEEIEYNDSIQCFTTNGKKIVDEKNIHITSNYGHEFEYLVKGNDKKQSIIVDLSVSCHVKKGRKANYDFLFGD